MNGIDFLLDTNVVLGLLKSTPETIALITSRQIHVAQCAYSVITRMELLGFPEITPSEDALIRSKLGQLMYFPLTRTVEEHAIQLRRNQKIKLPDAIIAASALVLDAELLTHDKTLLNVVTREKTFRSRCC